MTTVTACGKQKPELRAELDVRTIFKNYTSIVLMRINIRPQYTLLAYSYKHDNFCSPYIINRQSILYRCTSTAYKPFQYHFLSGRYKWRKSCMRTKFRTATAWTDDGSRRSAICIQGTLLLIIMLQRIPRCDTVWMTPCGRSVRRDTVSPVTGCSVSTTFCSDRFNLSHRPAPRRLVLIRYHCFNFDTISIWYRNIDIT